MNRRASVVLLGLVLVGVAKADGPKAPAVQEPELRLELLRRAKADQDARAAYMKWLTRAGKIDLADEAAFEASLNDEQKPVFRRLIEKMRRTDAENTERMGRIVERLGWPTRALVGRDGASSAWLLVQHADASPKFQRQCLDLMARLPRAEIAPSEFAYLTDRVLLAEGKKQRYGTQFNLVRGKCVPRPLEDVANVDRRRMDVGLPPLAEYFKESERFYAGASKK